MQKMQWFIAWIMLSAITLVTFPFGFNMFLIIGVGGVFLGLAGLLAIRFQQSWVVIVLMPVTPMLGWLGGILIKENLEVAELSSLVYRYEWVLNNFFEGWQGAYRYLVASNRYEQIEMLKTLHYFWILGAIVTVPFALSPYVGAKVKSKPTIGFFLSGSSLIAMGLLSIFYIEPYRPDCIGRCVDLFRTPLMYWVLISCCLALVLLVLKILVTYLWVSERGEK